METKTKRERDFEKEILIQSKKGRYIGLHTHKLHVPKALAKYYELADTYGLREELYNLYRNDVESNYNNLSDASRTEFLKALNKKYIEPIDFIDNITLLQLKQKADAEGYYNLADELVKAYKETAKELQKQIQEEITFNRQLAQVYLGKIDFTKAKTDKRNTGRIYIETKYLDAAVLEKFSDPFTPIQNKDVLYFESDRTIARNCLIEMGKLCYYFLGGYSNYIGKQESNNTDVLENQITLNIPLSPSELEKDKKKLNECYEELLTVMDNFLKAIFKEESKNEKEHLKSFINEFKKGTVSVMLDLNSSEMVSKRHEIERRTILKGNDIENYIQLNNSNVNGNEIILNTSEISPITQKVYIATLYGLNSNLKFNIKTAPVSDEERKVIIPAKDFSKIIDCKLSRTKEYMMKAQNELYEIRIRDVNKGNGRDTLYPVYSAITYDKIKNTLEVMFNPDYLKEIQEKSKRIDISTDTFKISNNKPLELTLALYLQERYTALSHYNKDDENVKEGILKIKVRTIAEDVLNLPKYEVLKNTGGIRRSILYPLIDTLNNLSEELEQADYRFKTKDFKKNNQETIIESEMDLIKNYWFINPKGKAIKDSETLEKLFKKQGFVKEFMDYTLYVELNLKDI